MKPIKKDTILKVGDFLKPSQTSNETWEIIAINGHNFKVVNKSTRQEGVVKKVDLISNDWLLQINDGRGYF
ncbi:MAG: hypothetical protein ACK40G_07850 [Cytophagaceae bacterium]